MNRLTDADVLCRAELRYMEDSPHTVERLLSVVAIQQEIATAKLDLQSVMGLVVERMLPLTGADGAAIELAEGDELVYRAASGTLAPHLGVRLEMDASISGLCIRTGELLRSQDTEADERVDRELCRKIRARSLIVVPLHHDRRMVGVLKVTAVEPGAFGEEEVYALQLMTTLIAAGMSHTAQFEAEQSLQEIREAERRRIARDLHDSVLQDISGALQNIQALQAERQSGTYDEEDGLEQSLDALRQAARGLREAIYNLRRDDEKPLINEVQALVDLNRQMSPECELTLHVESEFPQTVPEGVSRELSRIVHEGLVNIRRHSGARRASVTLGLGGGEVRVALLDDGRGFDRETMPEGIGLSGMRERVAATGCELQVRSAPDGGTSVKVKIPLSWS